jgi:hypothetical protein
MSRVGLAGSVVTALIKNVSLVHKDRAIIRNAASFNFFRIFPVFPFSPVIRYIAAHSVPI